jgi:hypothetical protein
MEAPEFKACPEGKEPLSKSCVAATVHPEGSLKFEGVIPDSKPWFPAFVEAETLKPLFRVADAGSGTATVTL